MNAETLSLYDNLKQYAASDSYPYHMPGHKRRLFGQMPRELFEVDITEIDGFDDLHHAEGILAQVQRRAAQIYGAEESFCLINGSSCGVLAALSAALPVGGRLLLARNCHRSSYHACYLRQLRTTYLYPGILAGWDICEAVTPAQVREALAEYPDTEAVLIVSPTYEGRIADVAQIARIVHEKNLPLIVDEAHGAHLGLAEGFAANSCQAGADLVIQSLHKTLPAPTQTALLHVNGERIDRERLRRFLRIYQSSSPSYVLMAGIDNCLRLLEEEGRKRFAAFRSRYLRMLEDLRALRHLRYLSCETGGQDIGKLVISTRECTLTGKQLYDRLRGEYGLQPEMAGETYCLAMFTVADTEEGYVRMTEALLAIDCGLRPRTEGLPAIDAGMYSMGEQEIIPLAEAWDMQWERLPLQDAVGRYAGEFVQLYPPGVPIVVPGERLTKEKYDTIVNYIDRQMNVQGVEKIQGRLMIKVLRSN